MHVMMSYSRKDKEFADLLEADLADSDHNSWMTWRDSSDIAGGSAWKTAIETAIGNSYALLVLHSKFSRNSEWVSFEIDLALRHRKPIVPVLLDASDLGSLSRLQTVDFSSVVKARGLRKIAAYRQAFRKLLDAVNEARPILRFIRELEDSDATVREQAANQLGGLGDPYALQPLLGALNDGDVEVRFAAVSALGKLRLEGATRPLIPLLSDEDADICAAAARALGRIGLPEAINPVSELLGHPDRFAREAACYSLSKLEDRGSIPRLIHIMRNDPISDVRAAAAAALQRIGGHEARRALRRADMVSGMSGTFVVSDDELRD